MSFYLCNIYFCEFFVSRHLLNEIDVNMLETIETRHFSTSNYIRSVVGEVHLLNLINELLLFLSISLIFDISIHGPKNKTCVTKTLFTNFTRRNCFLQVWKNLLIVLKIRSHSKLICIFQWTVMKSRKSLRVVSHSASSLVVYCL